MNTDEAIQTALNYQQKGNFQQAENIYRVILKSQPDNFHALNYLGVLYSQIGNYDSAIKHIKKALNSKSNFPEAYYNLGTVFQAKGQPDDAIVAYKKALQLNPNLSDAYYNLGLILQAKGQLDDAIAAYKKALQLNPNLSDTYNNLGLVLQNKGQLDDAIAAYKKALQLNPHSINAYFNLGLVLQAKGQPDDAIAAYKKALQLNPNLPDAFYNMGTALQDKGQLDDAVTAYKKALQLNPNSLNSHFNLGTVLQDKGQLDDAITTYKKALQLNPNLSDVYYNLGNTLQEQGSHDKALAAYDMALFCKLGYTEARWARCIAHLPIIYPDSSSIQSSRRRYHKNLLNFRDTIFMESSQDIDNAIRAVGGLQPFYLAYQGMNDRELQQLYGDLLCQIMASRYPKLIDRPAMPHLSSKELLRVGIVSGFFRYHSNWKIPIKGWVENLNKKRFSIYGYHTGKIKDKETHIARNSFYRFVEDINSFENLCKIIRADNLHVLIYPEIGMDPITAQLAALRLAPVQCTSWGHPETSGFPTIDYFISSELMEPTDADDHYSEKLIRLSNLSIYYTVLDVPYLDISRDMFNLRPNSILYLCPQSLYKYLPQYDEVYPRIAQQVGDCQFLFISNWKSSLITEQTRLRIKQTFNNFSLNADDYVVFLPFLDPEKYNAINRLSDVYLDSIGWSGCNTTFEALSCNLPVVTVPGDLMRGRHSSAILTMIGLTETIATSLDEYVLLAVKLGQDLEWRQYMSDKISENKHLSYRDRSCIADLEDFLERAVKEALN